MLELAANFQKNVSISHFLRSSFHPFWWLHSDCVLDNHVMLLSDISNSILIDNNRVAISYCSISAILDYWSQRQVDALINSYENIWNIANASKKFFTFKQCRSKWVNSSSSTNALISAKTTSIRIEAFNSSSFPHGSVERNLWSYKKNYSEMSLLLSFFLKFFFLFSNKRCLKRQCHSHQTSVLFLSIGEIKRQ